MKILIIGANGMIGSTLLRVLSESENYQTFGSVRDERAKRYFADNIAPRILANVDVENPDALVDVFDQVEPEVVINCTGLTKHRRRSDDPLYALPLNALLPHRLSVICKDRGARMIHISSDCVFSGDKGAYVEADLTDALDLYGKSKALGELHEAHTVTLRTSTIGRELDSYYGLLEWFLAQKGCCQGYTRAVFSGLPTVELGKIVRDLVIPRSDLSGLYHVAAQPITKFDLLHLIARVYAKTIDIKADDSIVIDRSLDASLFRQSTGYVAPEWPELIETMYAYG